MNKWCNAYMQKRGFIFCFGKMGKEMLHSFSYCALCSTDIDKCDLYVYFCDGIPVGNYTNLRFSIIPFWNFIIIFHLTSEQVYIIHMLTSCIVYNLQFRTELISLLLYAYCLQWDANSLVEDLMVPSMVLVLIVKKRFKKNVSPELRIRSCYFLVLTVVISKNIDDKLILIT